MLTMRITNTNIQLQHIPVRQRQPPRQEQKQQQLAKQRQQGLGPERHARQEQRQGPPGHTPQKQDEEVQSKHAKNTK